MIFYKIDDLSSLKEGYKGILEPDGLGEVYDYYKQNAADIEKTLIIMPGAAFDTKRNRIGYGGGFYDRFLADKEGLVKHSIAVGFLCQLVGEIPFEETDIRLQQVILV